MQQNFLFERDLGFGPVRGCVEYTTYGIQSSSFELVKAPTDSGWAASFACGERSSKALKEQAYRMHSLQDHI